MPEGKEALGRGETARRWPGQAASCGKGLQVGQPGLAQRHATKAGEQGRSVGLVGAPGRRAPAIQPQRDQRRIAAGQGWVAGRGYAGTEDQRGAGNGLIEHGSLAVGRRLRRVQDKGYSPALV